MSIPHSLNGTLALLGSAGRSHAAPEVRTVRHVNLPAYMGSWRVIACMDNPAERNFFDAVETYSLHRDGRTIGVSFEWRQGSFDAPRQNHRFRGRVVDQASNARWKMRLFPLFSASYLIIALGADYEWSAVAHPSRRFGWVLARERSLPGDTLDRIYGEFQRQGYDVERFIEVPQHAISLPPEQRLS